MEPTRVTVRLTARDYGAFIGFAMRSTLIKLQCGLGMMALLWVLRSWLTSAQHSLSNLLAMVGAVIVGILLFPKAWTAFFGWSTARKRTFWGATHYEIRDEGLYFKNNAEEGVRAWGSFQKAARKETAMYLLVTPISGFCFPDHCFTSREDATHFFEQIRKHMDGGGRPVNWQASRPPQTEPLDPAKVTVELEPADLRRFTGFLPGGRWRRFAFWAFVVLVSVAVLGSTHLFNAGHSNRPHSVHDDPLNTFLFTYGLPLIFVAVLGFNLWRATRPTNYRKRFPGIFVPRTYTVSDEGLFCKSETGETMTDWQAVVRFVETDLDFYLLLTKRNGIVLPKRCFSTKQAAAIFANQVRLHLEKHAPASLAAE